MSHRGISFDKNFAMIFLTEFHHVIFADTLTFNIISEAISAKFLPGHGFANTKKNDVNRAIKFSWNVLFHEIP